MDWNGLLRKGFWEGVKNIFGIFVGIWPWILLLAVMVFLKFWVDRRQLK